MATRTITLNGYGANVNKTLAATLVSFDPATDQAVLAFKHPKPGEDPIAVPYALSTGRSTRKGVGEKDGFEISVEDRSTLTDTKAAKSANRKTKTDQAASATDNKENAVKTVTKTNKTAKPSANGKASKPVETVAETVDETTKTVKASGKTAKPAAKSNKGAKPAAKAERKSRAKVTAAGDGEAQVRAPWNLYHAIKEVIGKGKASTARTAAQKAVNGAVLAGGYWHINLDEDAAQHVVSVMLPAAVANEDGEFGGRSSLRSAKRLASELEDEFGVEVPESLSGYEPQAARGSRIAEKAAKKASKTAKPDADEDDGDGDETPAATRKASTKKTTGKASKPTAKKKTAKR
jgi:hypothetical protein